MWKTPTFKWLFDRKLKQYILRSKNNPLKLYNNILRSFSIELRELITKVWILSLYKFWFKLNCTKNESLRGFLAAASKHSSTELNFQQKKKLKKENKGFSWFMVVHSTYPFSERHFFITDMQWTFIILRIYILFLNKWM